MFQPLQEAVNLSVKSAVHILFTRDLMASVGERYRSDIRCSGMTSLVPASVGGEVTKHLLFIQLLYKFKSDYVKVELSNNDVLDSSRKIMLWNFLSRYQTPQMLQDSQQRTALSTVSYSIIVPPSREQAAADDTTTVSILKSASQLCPQGTKESAEQIPVWRVNGQKRNQGLVRQSLPSCAAHLVDIYCC